MIDRAVWAALTAFAGTIMNELKSGHKVRCHLTAVDGWAGHRRSGIVCPRIARPRIARFALALYGGPEAARNTWAAGEPRAAVPTRAREKNKKGGELEFAAL